MNALIVDDDPIARLIIEKNLKLTGVGSGIQSAEDGKDAYEKINADLPKVILLDLNMPVMNGFELLEKIKGFKKVPAVYIITSSTLGEDRIKCEQYPCVHGFFEKPVTRESIQKVSDFISQNEESL